MRSLTDGLESSPATETKGGGGPGLRDKLNELIAGPAGMIVMAIIAGMLLLFVFSRLNNVSGGDPSTVMDSRVRMMNPATGELIWQPVAIGSTAPEGFYPVEYCWNNHPDEGAVPVILNVLLFPSSDPRHDEPTVCPCCGARVVGRNPKPQEFVGMTPKDHETDQPADCVTNHYSSVVGG